MINEEEREIRINNSKIYNKYIEENVRNNIRAIINKWIKNSDNLIFKTFAASKWGNWPTFGRTKESCIGIQQKANIISKKN